MKQQALNCVSVTTVTSENTGSRGAAAATLRMMGVGLMLVATAIADDFPKPVNTQAEGEHPPSPREMLGLFELPEGFHVTLFAGEPDVRQPIAFDFDDRGRIWVAENYSYGAHGKYDSELRDRVIILHDTDGDGEHDERHVFWDDGWMLTGLTRGYGGLWILNDGTLSFIPDRDNDDVPDGEPVEMLNGWTKGAGHNVVNGLLWGPDGWLYGRHGITDTSLPGTPDTPKEERRPMNCGIWRFHPVKHQFEIVCNGTTNPWGLDYNEYGDLFMSNNVIGHLWHVIPGAHYQRMFGQDFNPHLYELMEQCADHYHWDDTGKWTESRDGHADELGGGHSHCGLMIYYGQNFPKQYWGKAFMCNTHGRCINVDRLERNGSSYVAKHEPNFLKVNTPWFRGVELKYGPAGCVYLSDWSDNGECHDHDGVHRTSGRIYRIAYGEVQSVDMQRNRELSDETDVHIMIGDATSRTSNSEWLRRRTWLQCLENAEAVRKVAAGEIHTHQLPITDEQPETNPGSEELQQVWRFQLIGAMDAVDRDDYLAAIISPNPGIRAAALRYISEDRSRINDADSVIHAWMQHHESDPRVMLSYVQSGSFDSDVTGLRPRTSLLSRIAARSADDKPLLLMTWYLAEQSFQSSGQLTAGQRLYSIALREEIPDQLRRYCARRIASEPICFTGTRSSVNALLYYGVKAQSVSESFKLALLDGILDGLEGRGRQTPPPDWDRKDWNEASAAVNARLDRLDAIFGSGEALADLRKLVADRTQDHAKRSYAIQTLTQASDSKSLPIFLSLLNDRAVYAEIARALASFDDPRVPKELLKRWDNLRHGSREAAIDTLCSRRSNAVELARALRDGRVPPDDLSASDVRQLLAFNVTAITRAVEEKWGVIKDSTEAKAAAIEKWKKLLTDAVLKEANREAGAALFTKTCANCHRLYGEGGKIGPDLTGSNRNNMDYLLGNIVDPGAVVPKQFTMTTIVLESGRLVNGVVVGETAATLTVQTDKQLQKIAVADVAERVPTSKSLMPDGLLDALTEEQVRDLIAFLRYRRQDTF